MVALAPRRQPWWLMGVAGMVAAFLILSFYSEVVAWVFAYVLKALRGSLLSSDPAVTGAAFESLISDPVQSLLWQWGVLAFIALFVGWVLGIGNFCQALSNQGRLHNAVLVQGFFSCCAGSRRC